MLRALRHRNYRLFFLGQGVSLIGTWLTRVAMGWLVYQLAQASGRTGERAGFLLGAVTFAGLAPTFLLTPFAGVLVDRWNRHRTLIVTQVLALIQSVLLAVFTLAGTITIPQLMALAVFQGLINAFDAPARLAFTVEMVEDRHDLPNAIALGSAMFNGARLVGPAVAGLLMAAFGAGICFTIDAISYVAVVAALVAMRLPAFVPRKNTRHVLHELHEGIRYAFGFAPIRALLITAGLVSFWSIAYQSLMPIVADRLSGTGHGAVTYGFLLASVGVGSFAGALHLATRRSVLGLGRFLAISTFAFGLAVIGFAFAPNMIVAMPLLLLSGYFMISCFASANTMLQTIIDDHMRGRVMSLFTMAVMGMAPFGALLCGVLNDRIGLTWTLGISGVACVFAGVLFAIRLPALRRATRPIYQKKGIIPLAEQGDRSDAELEPFA